jgi:hypothetical protein
MARSDRYLTVSFTAEIQPEQAQAEMPAFGD